MAAPPAPSSPKAAAGPTQGVATVYQIKSGDTIVLCGPQSGKGKPSTKEISLAAVQAPRLGVKSPSHTTPDEPFAWESREYLRKLLLNKQVQFKVYYERNNRQYAEVRLDGKNIALGILEGGYAKLLETQETKKVPSFAEMQEAATAGETAKVGLYAGGAAPRSIANAMDAAFPLESFVEQNKGVRRKAIVEFVRDGGCLRVCILPEAGETDYVYIPILISGVNTPRRKGGNTENQVEYEPFYHECHFWVESRFLCREVEVRIEMMKASQNPQMPYNVYGSIYHPRGNLAEFLLAEGFGTYLDWTAKLTECGPKVLRDTQQKAQELKKRRWSQFDGNADGAGKEFNARVIEICSGDQIRVLNTDNNDQEMRLYLSSVRAPAGQSRARPQAEDYYRESVNYLRKRLIGKMVKCQPDYVKNVMDLMKKDDQGKVLPGQQGPPVSDDKGNLIFVTVMENGENVAIESVRQGFLDVATHRDTDDRSRMYPQLMDAQEEAQTQGNGKHSGKPSLKPNIMELTGAQEPAKRKEMARRAETMFEDLKKKEQTGVVQYCITGTRFRVLLEPANILIAFKCDGLNAPNVAPPNADPKLPNSKSEPFGEESLRETKQNIMQQDVKLRLDGVDRAGIFRGSCTFVRDKKKVNLGQLLVSKGLAYTDGWCENKDYLEAERIAKQNKLGWWSIEHEEEAAPVVDTSKGIKGELGNITSISSFYIVDSKGETSVKVAEALSKAAPDSMEGADDPKKGVMYVAKYYEDRKWYRVKCNGVKNRAQKTYNMLFVDFGIEVEVPLCDVKKLPAGHPLQKFPPVAVHCGLYGVKGNDENWNESCEALYNSAQGVVTAEIEMFRDGTSWVVLTSGSKCANLAVVESGSARLVKKQKPKSANVVYDQWEDAQNRARRARTGMWQYGDDYDSDDE